MLISSNKAPGQDGFPTESFRHFGQTISSLFYRITQELIEPGKIPLHMSTANITAHKDSTFPSSYHLLSLINLDIKIISKALSSRHLTVTPSIIHIDQTGFINGRQAKEASEQSESNNSLIKCKESF